MRNLCFGGSFNPIHHGHLLCARAAAEQGGYDKVVLIPSAQPPHKRTPQAGSADMAAADDRLAMCRLAVEGEAGFEVDDLELRRTGPSYTIETARQLRRRGWPEVHWLVGADQLRSLPSWHEPLALIREVRFVVIGRPGFEFDWSTMPPEYRHLADHVVHPPLIELSGTAIRKRVAEGKSIAYLTPPAVCRYIREHGLYNAPS